MENFADITDAYGGYIRVDGIPERVVITVRDEAIAAVSLDKRQVVALINALTDALGGGRWGY